MERGRGLTLTSSSDFSPQKFVPAFFFLFFQIVLNLTQELSTLNNTQVLF